MNHSISEYLWNASVKYGDKTAYIDQKTKVSFNEVESLSCKVAAAIISRHFFEKPILVLAERNVYTPVAFLGVARAGCYYVPIDPAQNVYRIKQILDIVKADLMIVNESTKDLVTQFEYSGDVIVLEELFLGSEDRYTVNSVENAIVNTMPLYVVFTSGSTGRPKGVITPHISLMNYIDAVDTILQLNEKDVLGSQSPFDYIAAIRDIYLPLKTGAATVIIPKCEFAMASELAATLIKYKVTVICWSAAGLEMCVKIRLFDELTKKYIRKVLFSGSILSGGALAEWQRNLPEAQFINQYGPTEATASCTYYIVKEKVKESTVLPIGVPYKNYKVFLLDENDRLVSNGDIGEICVSGPGVTLGYFADKERSAKVFIQNPLNDKYREVIYKTGDLGRYNSSGELEFCGRRDRQIKYMGHRIELEEIEHWVKKIEGVDECISVFDEEKKELCLAYAGKATKKQIVLYLRENLSAFMIPRRILKVDSIPRLANGKIDIKAIQEYIRRV